MSDRQNTPAVLVKAEPDEFAALTEKQKLFVVNFVDQGTGNASEAARCAGYSEKGARKEGHRLLQLDHVKRAIMAELQSSLHAGVAQSVMTLRTIAGNPNHRQSVAAATAILDRAGFSVVQQQKIEVTVKSDEEKIREIAESARVLGRRLADVFGVVTSDEKRRIEHVLGPGILDAEFEETK